MTGAGSSQTENSSQTEAQYPQIVSPVGYLESPVIHVDGFDLLVSNQQFVRFYLTQLAMVRVADGLQVQNKAIAQLVMSPKAAMEMYHWLGANLEPMMPPPEEMSFGEQAQDTTAQK